MEAKALNRHGGLGADEVKIWRCSVRADGDLVEYYVLFAYALAHNLFDAAARLAEVATNPRDALSLFARGRCLLALNLNDDFTRGLRLANRLIPWLTEMDGPDGTRTLNARNLKARLLLTQGNAVEAEAAFRDILLINERVWGSEHAETIFTKHGLAVAVMEQGKAAEAEAMFRDVLSLMERVQGPEHPGTLATRHELASAILAQGRAAEAEAAFRDLLPLREQVQGPEHPGTLATRYLLSRAIQEQGAAEQAREHLSARPDSGDQRPDD